eukprot:scaffold1944_cov241-Pinguiococcus_pyrenoidosus.AAC.30
MNLKSNAAQRQNRDWQGGQNREPRAASESHKKIPHQYCFTKAHSFNDGGLLHHNTFRRPWRASAPPVGAALKIRPNGGLQKAYVQR